jgi:hypothetical protein
MLHWSGGGYSEVTFMCVCGLMPGFQLLGLQHCYQLLGLQHCYQRRATNCMHTRSPAMLRWYTAHFHRKHVLHSPLTVVLAFRLPHLSRILHQRIRIEGLKIASYTAASSPSWKCLKPRLPTKNELHSQMGTGQYRPHNLCAHMRGEVANTQFHTIHTPIPPHDTSVQFTFTTAIHPG